MNVDGYLNLRKRLIMAGYAGELKWAASIKTCSMPVAFRDEYCWVVLNSGMKEQIARQIWARVRPVMMRGESAATVFGHKLKAKAIDDMWRYYHAHFTAWQAKTEPERMIYLRTLPFIGEITVYHFAKNLGMDVAKPDRHLVRIAAETNETTDQLCRRIANATGHRIAVIDTVLWRAANLGFV